MSENLAKHNSNAKERMLPLYEGKMIHHYDYRWATYFDGKSTRDTTFSEKQDLTFHVQPRHWIRETLVADRLKTLSGAEYLLGVRDICRNNDERTVIASLIPETGVGHTLSLVFQTAHAGWLTAILNSFVLDYIARPKISGVHFSFFIANQLAIIPPTTFQEANTWLATETIGDWVDLRVETLMVDFRSREFRARLRADLDGLMFHLYGMSRDEVDYVMDTFPIVKSKDEAEHGEYRTKRLILEVYDAMASAKKRGTAYISPVAVELEQTKGSLDDEGLV